MHLDDGAVVRGDRVVLAAGAWSRDLLPASVAAGLTLYRQSTLYYDPGPYLEAWARTPAIPAIGVAQGAWLVPSVAGTPLRLSAHGACREVAGITGHDTPGHWRDYLVSLFRTLLVGFDADAVLGARDGYYLADTSSGGPVLAALGASAGAAVWAYAACGGASFKLAPLIARSIAARVVGTEVQVTGLDFLDHPWVLPGALMEA